MIDKKILRTLIGQKLKDADVLLANKRYSSAVYLSGYALEIALKLKICKLFTFINGFPENKAEFTYYQNSVKSQPLLAGAITQIREIKHHELGKLLFYSGAEYNIKLTLLREWNLVVNWTPEMRYRITKILKKDATENIVAIKLIIQSIL
jgi:hypothetical protein